MIPRKINFLHPFSSGKKHGAGSGEDGGTDVDQVREIVVERLVPREREGFGPDRGERFELRGYVRRKQLFKGGKLGLKGDQALAGI